MPDSFLPATLKGGMAQRSNRLQDWLVLALPEFGIIQSSESKDHLAFMLADIQFYDWLPSIFPTFAEFLCDKLQLTCDDHALIIHSLRRWSESGNVLWVRVDANDCTDEQLLELLSFRPVNHSGQFALRIVLHMSDQRGNRAALRPLMDVIPERLNRQTPVKQKQPKQAAFLALGMAILAIGIYLGVRATLAFLPDYGSTAQLDNINDRTTPSSGSGVTTVTGLPELLPSEAAAVKEVIVEWVQAWSNQSVSSYLSFYHEDYSGRKEMSPDEWRRWRVNRLMDPLWIRIEVGPISVEALEGRVRASFWQIYRSPNYQDETLKELLLKRSGNRWVIVDETSREVRPL
jgi:hypothetical protein